jgi:hypothetical protein
MISIEFKPVRSDPAWSPGWVPIGGLDYKPMKVEDLTQTDFIFDNFRVNVAFRVGEVDLSASAQFVPVLDFVLMIETARRTLRSQDSAILELSDRQGEWHFMRDPDSIALRTRYATKEGWRFHPGTGQCQSDEFDRVVDTCLREALDLLFAH